MVQDNLEQVTVETSAGPREICYHDAQMLQWRNGGLTFDTRLPRPMSFMYKSGTVGMWMQAAIHPLETNPLST